MAWVLVVLFIVVPTVELAVIFQVADLLGWPQTLALLLVESLLGCWLVKREGWRAWRSLRRALSAARLPSRELADAALVLVGGTLLLTPGFLTDIVGFFLVVPLTRPLARRLLLRLLERRVLRAAARRPPPQGPRRSGRVLRGEVVDDDDEHGAQT